ncbi:uncharacterized protein G2W53_025697 [Senna tora]|uniref:Uncharacterized protein n=1 Tax=Senna tora TaxID=362788 RepID=A0A834TDN1_9FABA|nr:uncharacterized protein G2W53_025697 [Senna tora]
MTTKSDNLHRAIEAERRPPLSRQSRYIRRERCDCEDHGRSIGRPHISLSEKIL